jgi:hypothetical protein
VQLADLSSGGSLPPGEDEVLESILSGKQDERLRVVGWKTPSDLRNVLDGVLKEELALLPGEEEQG